MIGVGVGVGDGGQGRGGGGGRGVGGGDEVRWVLYDSTQLVHIAGGEGGERWGTMYSSCFFQCVFSLGECTYSFFNGVDAGTLLLMKGIV